jgi:hypothetical protein
MLTYLIVYVRIEYFSFLVYCYFSFSVLVVHDYKYECIQCFGKVNQNNSHIRFSKNCKLLGEEVVNGDLICCFPSSGQLVCDYSVGVPPALG